MGTEEALIRLTTTLQWHRGDIGRQGQELLVEARDLVAGSWTQHADARRSDGSSVDPWDREAASWSLLGALVAGYERLIWSDGQSAALGALAAACVLLANVLEAESLSEWNDTPARTKADVLAALDEAARQPLADRRSANWN